MNVAIDSSREELIQQLYEIGKTSYHHLHPFHQRMHQGLLSQEEIRSWIANRFYYQWSIPVKDAVILSKLPGPRERRMWVKRLLDQDGTNESNGGLEAWLRMGEAAGLKRQDLLSFSRVTAKVMTTVDSYVQFCRDRSWLEAVASSLTELFSPQLIANRIEVFKQHYTWINGNALDYFVGRLEQAPDDSNHALQLVIEESVASGAQQLVIQALQFKCSLLWTLLDGIEEARLP